MNPVFADTGCWIALLNPRDGLHAMALHVERSLRPRTLCTTEMVLAELLNEMAARGAPLRSAAIAFCAALQARADQPNADVLIVPQTPELFRTACSVYRQHRDKAWSLTDCASYAGMRERGLSDALTHDRHFEQMGFVALLRTRA